MNSLPFSISADAAAWIVEKLRTFENEPDLAGFVPGLYFFLDERIRNEQGQVVEWCPGPFFDVCWDRPENVSAQGYVEMSMFARQFFSPPDALKKLEGKQLILDTVEVGFLVPADRRRKILRFV